MRGRWVLTWESTGKAKGGFCHLEFQDPDLTEARQPHTFRTGCGIKLAACGVVQVVVRSRGAPQHLHRTSRWCARYLEAQPRVNAETSESSVWSPQRPEQMVESYGSITSESRIHILPLDPCTFVLITQNRVQVLGEFMWMTCWEEETRCLKGLFWNSSVSSVLVLIFLWLTSTCFFAPPVTA